MVRFRNTAEGQSVQNWWDNGNNQIAFSRGNKGKRKEWFIFLIDFIVRLAFVVINNDDYGLSQWFQTGLPQGQYCDVISGNLDQGRCTGTVITVQGDGRAQITISNSQEDPMVAIHVDAKL